MLELVHGCLGGIGLDDLAAVAGQGPRLFFWARVSAARVRKSLHWRLRLTCSAPCFSAPDQFAMIQTCAPSGRL